MELIYADDEYKILNSKNDYILCNLQAEYKCHAHFKKADTCFLLIKLIKRNIVPKSRYMQEAAIRVCNDEKYIEKIKFKQKKDHNKEMYFNVNKGL